MKYISDMTLIMKINELSSKYIMPLMAVLFLLSNTVVNLWIGGKIETLQNLLAIVIICVVGCNILRLPKVTLPCWTKNNYFILIYFIFRAISLYNNNFDYSVLRTIFFEVFYLVGISTIVIGDSKQYYKYLKIFIYVELVFSLGSVLLYAMSCLLNGELKAFLETYTYIEESGVALLFSNPNSAGIMSGFAIIIGMVLYREGLFNKYFLICYCIYNVGTLILFGCRSADIGVLVSVFVFLVVKYVLKINKNTLVCISLVIFLASLVPIYMFIDKQYDGNYYCLNEREVIINELSTYRYSIWKECYIIQKEKPFLGYGSLKMEKEVRQELINSIDQEYYYNLDPNNFFRFTQATKYGPHNGYISMLLGTGIIGLIIFACVVLQRIKTSSLISHGNWYLIFIFIFVVNCFESLFVLNRFFTCFYMFLLLPSYCKKDSCGGEDS